jgi:hypothetical protein
MVEEKGKQGEAQVLLNAIYTLSSTYDELNFSTTLSTKIRLL